MEQDKFRYSGFWRRLSASLVDILITMPVLIALMYLLGLDRYTAVQLDDNLYSLVENKQANINRTTIDIVSLIVVSIYYIAFIASARKATLGKMLFGICVVDTKGHQLTKLRAFARFMASTILVPLTLGIAVIMVAFTKEKTALYDLVCDTRVIRKNYNKDEDEE